MNASNEKGASKVFKAMCWGGKADGRIITVVSPSVPEETRKQLDLHAWIEHDKQIAVQVAGVRYVHMKFHILDPDGDEDAYVPTAWVYDPGSPVTRELWQQHIINGLNFVLDLMGA